MQVERPIGPGFFIFFNDVSGGPFEAVDRDRVTDDDDMIELITMMVNAHVFD